MRVSVPVRIVLTLLLTLPISVRGQASVSLPLGAQGPGAAVEDLNGNNVDLIDYVK
ncbi:uncharacterized protein METZ01_LOCUS176929, partial [marine metagenome]